MASNGGGRKRWTERRELKEPTLYDEWLKLEHCGGKKTDLPIQVAAQVPGDTTAAIAASPGSTIRAVTPDETADETASVDARASTDGMADDAPIVPGRGTSSFERFKPFTTTTIMGGLAAAESIASAAASPKPKKLLKERSAPGSRSGGSPLGVPARGASKASSHRSKDAVSDKPASKSSRARAKTFEELRTEGAETDTPVPSRDRTGSMNVPPAPSSGAEYLASVPAETSPPSAPSIDSIERSLSPAPSSNGASVGGSKTSSHKESSARRILHLMKTLNGRYSGSVLFRRKPDTTWNQIYCYIEEENGDLIREAKNGESGPQTLVSGLRGCSVRPNVENELPHLEVNLPLSETEIHVKVMTQVDFDSWYAALLYWQSLGPIHSSMSNGSDRPSTSTSDTVRPDVPPRGSSARKRKERKGNSKSEKRKSAENVSKEAPVIKIGKMMYWEVGLAHEAVPNGSNSVNHRSVGAPHVHRTHDGQSRRWRWVNGQLRENGELTLHSDTDSALLSVVQLSQLSRCAIQRLDPSVMDDEFCIAIYPQYTSIPSDNPAGIIRPIFLCLKDRVLFEVWFVLLRAFTIPQLYGPRIASENIAEPDETDTNQDLENMLATQTTDMFRMERSLSIRIIEAKMHYSNANPTSAEITSANMHNKPSQTANAKSEQHGYYAEVLLDNEIRGKTVLKFDGLNPMWGEGFEFLDLPPVLSSASVVVKRRSFDAHTREQQENRHVSDLHGPMSDQQNGPGTIVSNMVCGKVEIYLQELEDEKEVEKWWPVFNMYNQRVGEMLIKARAEESVILMARDYQPLNEILHRFGNGITLKIAQILPVDLKRVSDCLLNIYQVSGKAGEWIMALAEEEIDGVHKEMPITKLRFDRRVGSDGGHETFGAGRTDRELIVRDMNKTATFEANLLFRGNTLLTKSLDTHMRRIGKEYLEESLGSKLRVINSKDPECEVDPNRVEASQDVERNWRRLLLCTQEVWKGILAASSRCPIELRLIFRHIRGCAEDRYGDFLRTVSYSSVSGFLFLRFFCPAVLNPKLFGLLEEDIKPRARRTFTLIAKSLQTLSNMASFGAKETWMEPMNAFLTQNRASFKSFIDDVCYVPAPLSVATYESNGPSLPTYPPDVVSTESNLSYNTPVTVMQRLPPTSREGFPSLPFLIDQPRACAELVQLWLEASTATPGSSETPSNSRAQTDVVATVNAVGGDLLAFHEICTSLHGRTQDCLSRAERAERPNSASSFKWDELIEQLRTDGNEDELLNPESRDGVQAQTSFDLMTNKIDNDASLTSALRQAKPSPTRELDDPLPSDLRKSKPSELRPRAASDFVKSTDRPGSSGVIGSLKEGLRRAQLQSRGSDSASVSNVSSAVSSDTEHTTGTTALPSYEREIRHRERREAAKQQIKQHVEAARVRESEKERRKLRTPIVSALRKKNQRESKSAGEGYTSYGA